MAALEYDGARGVGFAMHLPEFGWESDRERRKPVWLLIKPSQSRSHGRWRTDVPGRIFGVT